MSKKKSSALFARIYKVAPEPKERPRKGAVRMYAAGDCLAVNFRKLKPLIVDHHEWDGVLQANVTPCRNAQSDATMELVGNAKLRLAGVDVGLDRDSWANWKANVEPFIAEACPDDPAAGRYISTAGDWSLGFHVIRRRKWDARKKR
jgi:hypothetical protein